MGDRRRPRGADRTREVIAREAAVLMVREGVSQYFEAKRIAARRVLGHDDARHRPGGLPSNGEIREQVLALVALSEGEHRVRRLFAMRVVALEVMRALADWHPRLIGSVWSGHARRGSDIDVHVFGELDALAVDLERRGWDHEHDEVLFRVGNAFRTYHHLHLLDHPFPVELSVYPLQERREVTRSSVDGRPIDRVSASRLEDRLREEHAEDYAEWLRTGELDLDLGPEAGDFDALLTTDEPHRG
ncbi:MAG: nucleotide-binding enzyme [Myxococcales bacterium]|nr:nucleotide-binding enzyme [Myxococcales bacterium]